MSLSDITPEIWTQDEEKWEAFLNENYDSVPLLNVNGLKNCKPGTLVKFYGMVQDYFNIEYYTAKYEVIHTATNERRLRCGKYVDILQCNEGETIYEESQNTLPGERQTLMVTSVPALNDWVNNFYKNKFTLTNRNKMETSATTNKRALETDDSINDAEENHDNSQHKRSRYQSSSNDDSTSLVSQEVPQNFYLPDYIHFCHAHIYKNFDEIKLNDMVEIVGFLSVDSNEVEYDQSELDENNLMERRPDSPSSLLLRIHCVAWKRIEHNNCLISSDSNMQSEEFMHLKDELHLILTQLLLGDTVAAEYFLYHLISKVYSNFSGMSFGKFALNISHIPIEQVSEFGQKLYGFIEDLLPKSAYLSLSVENLNTLTFIPYKDYEKDDRLTSGILQLSNNTNLILDETKLKPGLLSQSGIKAVDALSNLIKWQRMDYDFKYYSVVFDCDIPCLILSEGKSLLPSNFHVILKPDASCINTFDEIVAVAKQILTADLLNKLRMYLTLARFAQYCIDDDINDLISKDFAQMRQEQSTNAEDLHNLLVLARLICLSEGKTRLDQNSWKRACSLETERKIRIAD